MRKLEIAEPEVMRIAIQQEIARSGDSHVCFDPWQEANSVLRRPCDII